MFLNTKYYDNSQYYVQEHYQSKLSIEAYAIKYMTDVFDNLLNS